MMYGGLVPRIERNCRACTQTTQHHIPEERDLLSQRKCKAYHTIPLHTHKKVMVELSQSAETDPRVKTDDHDLQRQTLRYKWMIMMICRQTLKYKCMVMICRDRPSGSNG
jgi:hypothetical protein